VGRTFLFAGEFKYVDQQTNSAIISMPARFQMEMAATSQESSELADLHRRLEDVERRYHEFLDSTELEGKDLRQQTRSYKKKIATARRAYGKLRRKCCDRVDSAKHTLRVYLGTVESDTKAGKRVKIPARVDTLTWNKDDLVPVMTIRATHAESIEATGTAGEPDQELGALLADALQRCDQLVADYRLECKGKTSVRRSRALSRIGAELVGRSFALGLNVGDVKRRDDHERDTGAGLMYQLTASVKSSNRAGPHRITLDFGEGFPQLLDASKGQFVRLTANVSSVSVPGLDDEKLPGYVLGGKVVSVP
jgi:hypothetical protein